MHKTLNKENKLILTITAITALLSFILFLLLRFLFLKNGFEYGVDVFYHIRMGEFFPDVCMNKTFPWTQLSIWKTSFYDKELGFHFILSMLITIQNLIGIKITPPFNYINLGLITLLSIMVIFFCLKHKLQTAYLALPLLFFISPLFLLRINMIRPHILSIVIFMLIIYVLTMELTGGEKILSVFFLCWIYTYCYSVPHIVFVVLIAYIISDLIINKKFKYIFYIFICLAAFAGIAAGIVFHPQFPNSIYCWYIQGVMVINKILGLKTGYIDLGLELLAPNKNTLFQNISVFLIFIINVVFLLKNNKKQTNKTVIHTLFFVELIMTIGFFFSERCIEYAIPCAVLCFVFLLDTQLNVKCAYKIVFNLLLILVIFLVMFPVNKEYLRNSQYAPCSQFAAWASKNIKPGTYIGQIRWGEFPRLFYPAPQYRYSMAMDPMFSYYKFPQKTERLEKFRMLIEPIPAKQLAEILGTNLVFISKYDPLPAEYLIKTGAKILYSGKDGHLLLLMY